VEGEFNWLSLQAQSESWQEPATRQTHPTGFDWMNELDAAPRFALAGMAIGSKEGADLQTVRGVLNHETPLVLYDNDEMDDATGIARGYTLVDAINLATSIWVNTTPCKDTDDWVKQYKPKPSDLLSLAEEAVYKARPYSALADDIAKAAKVSVKAVSECLWEDLLTRCTIYNAGGEGTLVTREPVDNEVFLVRPDSPTWSDLMLRCGLETSDKLCGALGVNITTRVQTSDAAIKIDHLPVLSHYNKDTRTMYVDELDRVLRINPNGEVDVIRNGDDGVIFAPAGDKRHADLEMKPGSLKVYDGYFKKHILDCVIWEENKGIDKATAMQLYKTHVLSIFFDTLMHDKAVPIFEGPAGGGKNTLTQMTGMLFEGAGFGISAMPVSGKELDELTVDKIYAGFDEYDSTDPAIEKAFRSWCTRQWAERRELYTTFGKARRALARGMGLSTNFNPTLNAATGSRQLMFQVSPRQTTYGDKAYLGQGTVLIPGFMKVRDLIWSELIADLCRVVEAYGETKDWSKVVTGFRMADFAQLMLICAESEGWVDEADDMLRQMSDTQTHQMGERNLFIRLLTEYLLERPEMEGQYHTMSEWTAILSDRILQTDRQAKQILTINYVRRMLTGSEKPTLATRFDVHEGTKANGKWNPNKKINTFAFTMLDRTAIDSKPGAAATPKFVVEDVKD
jgi:hypothetical protein